MKKLLLTLAFLAFAAPVFAQDDAPPPPKVHARLVAEDTTVAPGASLTVALEQKIEPGWHTYWINPGDAGAATEIAWTLPPGWTAGAILWPAPKRLPVPPFMNYGYENKVWLLTRLAVPATAKPGDSVTLNAKASWLVCRQVCIPEDTTLSLPVKIGAATTPDASVAADFAAARAQLPVASPWKLNYALGDATLDIYAAAPGLAAAHPKDVVFFPLKPGIVDGPAEQKIGFTKDGLVLRLKPGDKAATAGGMLDGVLVLTSSDGSVQAVTVHAPPGPVPAADFAGTGALPLAMAVLFAFLGGIILNVMPCVLPILAMKALAMTSSHAARESFAYAAGAILSFLVLGAAIILLRQGGAAIGWGFQLQEPLVVAGFALLVFAVGLNLSGLFEVGSITAGEGLASRAGLTGAFFTGVLAVGVAAPCTAPYMAVALGVALAAPPASALLVFLGLGLGFALPFLILGVWPRARTFLPKPGPWMLRLKQFLAFPMYATAVWLVWVLAAEAGSNGVAFVLGAMVALALAAWLWSVTRDLPGRGRALGATAALLVLLGALYGVSLLRGQAAPPVSVRADAQSYSAAKLAQLRAQNRPVFVDATAAWCITCLVNEDGVLKRPAVSSAFAARNVAYVVADWTSRNGEITRLLKDNGRSGVPLYLYYAPGAAAPVILPQLLTEGIVLAAIGAR